MKTTVDLDERKLRRLMRLTGLKTRKATIDFALTEAERLAKIKKLFQEPFYLGAEGPVVDPDYDVISMRKREKPRDASR